MTYLLLFLLVLCGFLLIKKSIQLKKKNNSFIQLELEKAHLHLLFKDYVFNRNLQNEMAVFDYFKQYGLGENEEPKDVRVYDSLAKHFENIEQQEL